MLPHWPQLPKRSKKERFLEQTVSALVHPGSDAFPRGSASGWSQMWHAMKDSRGSYYKTQVAGPITLFGKFHGSGSKGAQKLLESISLWLRHAYWQIEEIKDHGLKPILVLDEPLLPTFMGPLGSERAKRTLKLLRSIVKRLRRRGALVGVHCCNRISPSLLIDIGVDLIHFDAFYFPTQIIQAREELRRFMKDGGVVAWGIIPTNETLTSELKGKLEKNFAGILEFMESRNLPLKSVLAQSMISPTCGTGFLTVDQNEKIVDFANSLSLEMKKRYKLGK
ncbi:MAG: hypothetical protein AB1540_09935 [Bdellovibrionota bacterium]